MTVLVHPSSARSPAATARLQRATGRIAAFDPARRLSVRLLTPDEYSRAALRRQAERLSRISDAPDQPGAASLRTAAAALRLAAGQLDAQASRLSGGGGDG